MHTHGRPLPKAPSCTQFARFAVSLSGSDPTGSITFTAYGPDDATCTGTPIDITTRQVSGNGFYGSDAFRPSQAGTYRFIASYSGDDNNEAVSTSCADSDQSVVVTDNRIDTAMSTHVSDSTALFGDPVSDTAELGPGGDVGGAVTFDLYGP